MGFNEVYKVLLEIFPEVDSRALRAVAIENQKDADLAVEVVLAEVIPFLTEKSPCNSSFSETGGILQSSEAAEVFGNGHSSEHNVLVENVRGPDEEQHGPFYYAKDVHDLTFDDTKDMNADIRPEEVPSVNNCNDRSATNGSADISSSVSSAVLIHENAANEINANGIRISGDHGSEEISTGVSQESNIRVRYDQISQLCLGPVEENLGSHQSLDNCLYADSNDGKNYEKNIPVDNYVGLLYESDFIPISPASPESMLQLVDMPDVQNNIFEKELNGPKDAATNTDSFNEMVDVEDEPMLKTVVTGSSQVFSIDLLEDIIADARNNKKTLLSALETIVRLMKEVEMQEKAAEQAKQYAANGGLGILKRVEDLKQMLQRAKEANDMHAGEIYGEKAILATEVKELQSRLLCLSDERDRSLGILDEMRQSLEMRLAAAEKERKMAEEEKLEKEAIAWKALKNQEAIMEKVVQEANFLKQEAEDNAKLREFLMDGGRVVDTLQGEISVICMDVRMLKEKLDERLPLSRSLTSSQTSCIVASSSSSSKSMTSQQMDGADPSETPEKKDIMPLDQPPEKTDIMPFLYEAEFFREQSAADDHKELTDEGWEIFDNCDATCKSE